MAIFSAWHWYLDDDAKWHITPFFRSWAQHDVDDLRVEDMELNLSLGAAGSLSFILRPSNICYDAFTKFRSYILIYRDGKDIIWAGRVIKESKDLYNAYTVEAEGLLAQFNDCLIPTPSKDSDGNRLMTKTISEWAKYIIQINEETDSISGLPANGLRRISMGSIAGGSNLYTLSASSPTKALTILQDIQDEFNGYFIIRIENKEEEGVYPYLDFVLDETSSSSSSEAQDTKATGTWPYWTYTQSGWSVSTLGNWSVTVNRPVGSDYATVTGTIQMMSPGGQSAAWSVVVTVNGTSYTYSDAVKGYGNGEYVHVSGKYYTLSKSFQIPVSASSGSLSGTIKFQCVGVSELYKSAFWNIKYDSKTKSDSSEIGRAVRAEINFGENLLTLSQDSDGTDIYTVLEAYGTTPEDEDDPIDLTSVNDGKKYVTSSNIKEFGAIATTKTFEDIEDPSELLAEAKKEVEKLSKSKLTLSFDALDLHDIDDSYEAFDIGDKIKVQSDPNNINDYFTIKSMSYKLSKSGTLHPSIIMEEEKDGYISKTFHDTKRYKNELDSIKATYATNKELQKNIIEAVTSVVYDYALSTNKNDPPINDSAYSSTMPERQMGYYIWMRTRTYKGYSATPSDVSYACITGDKGDRGDSGISAYSLVISSSNGTSFLNGNINTTLTASLYYGSEKIDTTGYIWSRVTGNTALDKIWNSSHSSNKSNTQVITADDFDNGATFWATLIYSGVTVTASVTLTDLTDITTYIYYSDGTTPTINPTSESTYIGIYNGPPIAGGQPDIPPATTMWAKIKGNDGLEGASISTIQYWYVATSKSSDVTRGVNPPDSQWTTDTNSIYATLSPSKPYRWSYVVIMLSNGTVIYTDPCIDGTCGDYITSTASYYKLTSTDSVPSADSSEWSLSRLIPSFANKYLWVKKVDTYFSGTVINNISLECMYGDNGATMNSVKYYYLASSNSSYVSVDDSGWTTDIINTGLSSSKPYLWMCYKITYTNGIESKTSKPIKILNPATTYSLTNIVPYYISSNINSYNFTATSTGGWDFPNDKYPSYGWTKTIADVVLSDQHRYLWTYFRINGSFATTPIVMKTFGSQVTDMVQLYYISDSNTELTGGEWINSSPNISSLPETKYVWTRLKIVLDNDEIYSTPSLCSDITSLNSEIKNINGNIVANMVTKSDLSDQLGAYVSTNTYNAEYGSIEKRLSAVELTSADLNVAFEGANYLKSFKFSEEGLHISSGEEGAVETILDNDSFIFIDASDVVQLELTSKGVDMHSAYINDTLDFKENNTTKWRLSTYKDNSFNIDWIG